MLIKNLKTEVSTVCNYKGDLKDFYESSKNLFKGDDEPVISDRRVEVECSNEEEKVLFTEQIDGLYMDYLPAYFTGRFDNPESVKFQLVSGVGYVKIV